MMSEVILPKACGIGQADGEVGEDGKQTIEKRSSKGQIMADFMDGEEEVLVCCGSNNVGRQEERPGHDRRVLE